MPNEPKTNPSFVEGEGTDDEWLVRLDFFLRRARASAAASCEIMRTTPYVHNVEHVRGDSVSAPLSLCTYLIHAGACSKKKNLQYSTATGQQTPSGMLELKKKNACFLSQVGEEILPVFFLGRWGRLR